MSFITVPVTDIRERIRAILDSLERPVFVTQHGRVRAVLMAIEDYNNMIDELDDARLAADPEIRRTVADIGDAYKRGDMIPLEAIPNNGV